jgi:hypothetical protein
LGPGKNGGYHRAGRVGVSTGGRLRWGRINISAHATYDKEEDNVGISQPGKLISYLASRECPEGQQLARFSQRNNL